MSSISTGKLYSRERNIKGIVPLILLIGLVIDSALPAMFPNQFIGNEQTIVSHLLVYFIVTFAFYLRNSYISFYSFIFGLLHDSYNTTLLGFYAIVYFLITWLILSIRRYFPRNAIVHFMLFIVMVSIIEFVTYFFYLKVGIAELDLRNFIITRLGPTLIFNTALSFFMYLPTRGLLQWLGYDDHIIF
ncbi:rod shape-determining protein MreD [Facklamia lactis]|uniref:rod shape-determining protein MreD n=1 Tax=Facklamia lactis TaxID=2749967 RepID=UPI0018CFB83D|nr:rod shape-determining protein MreD [Facklamia lactis]MBG9979672.1 rod shape-determining protein MreD [Facklamia lactis]